MRKNQYLCENRKHISKTFNTTTNLKLINQILSAKKENVQADTTKLERGIDKLVYELYELSEEEIGVK